MTKKHRQIWNDAIRAAAVAAGHKDGMHSGVWNCDVCDAVKRINDLQIPDPKIVGEPYIRDRKKQHDFLRDNKPLWEGLGPNSPDYRSRVRKIIALMREAGLISPRTNDCDITLMGMINRVRREEREKQ